MSRSTRACCWLGGTGFIILIRNQNTIFKANWICREGRAVAEIVPTPVAPIVLAGRVNCGVLNALKNSLRNINCRPSLNGIFFTNVRSKLYVGGPVKVFRPALPQLNGAGEVNAAGLNHRSMVRLSGVGFT